MANYILYYTILYILLEGPSCTVLSFTEVSDHQALLVYKLDCQNY